MHIFQGYANTGRPILVFFHFNTADIDDEDTAFKKLPLMLRPYVRIILFYHMQEGIGTEVTTTHDSYPHPTGGLGTF